MKLTMLGTGNALVTECYNTCFVIEDNGDYFMVDGGGGNTILHQLKAAGFSWKDMKHIFVTHKHLDHLMGIIWMVRMITQYMKQGQYEGEAYIYAHDEVISIIHEMAGRLLPDKQVRLIDDRLHLVELSDGDEPYKECEECYVSGSDWLLHEAFCLHSESDIFNPYEKHHSTVKDACELAEQLGIKNLILYHTEDKNIKKRKEIYASEGIQYFSGNLYIPDDLEQIIL